MRALVIAHGEPPSIALVAELAAGAGLVVAADGGVDWALAAGIEVDAVVGDLDSASPQARAVLGEHRFHHHPDFDTTDLQKAILFCLDRGATEVDILAASGGRADHALANLSVLTLYRDRARLRIVDDLFEVSLVTGTATVDAPEGTVVSLVAIGQCRGVTTTGMRWNLTGYDLAFSPYGVHNEIARPPATVSVREGDLLLFCGRWVERNR
jgi:thiamine pyrophosphokinase